MEYHKMLRGIAAQQVQKKPVFPRPSLGVGVGESLLPQMIQLKNATAFPVPQPGRDYRSGQTDANLYDAQVPVSEESFPKTFWVGEALWT